MNKNIEVAKAVYEESKALSRRHPSKDFPDLNEEENFQKRILEAPLPSVEEMANVLDIIFWTSLLLEEGRPCCPRLLYSTTTHPQKNLHKLSTPLALNSENLKKITPAQGSVDYLTWKMVNFLPVITGIQVHQASEAPQLIFSVPSTGVIDIAWQYSRIVTFHGGKIRQLSKSALLDSSRLYALVSKILESFEPHFLGSIVRKISKQGHGGALWITCDAKTPQDIDITYKIENDNYSLLERFDNPVSRDYWLSSIANLAAVDGAVLLDSHLRVLGYGSFIKIDKPIEIDRHLADGTHESISSTSLGGGRHRSAVAFCNAHAPAAAIVVSMDGGVTFIASLKEKAKPLCAEIAVLGFSDKFL